MACDLDGTLLGPAGSADGSVREGLAALRAAGVPVVVCTGRMVRSARRQLAELGLSEGPVVCYGGALVADLAEGTWLRHEPVGAEDAAALVRFARRRGLHVNAYVDDQLYVEQADRWTEWTTAYARVTAALVDDLLPVVARGPTKLVIATDPDDAGRVAAEVSARFAGRLRAATSLPHFVEVNAAGVNKAAALDRLCAELLAARRERTVACGDGRNDADMLEWAGFAVAVEEGAGELRAAADAVVPRAALGAYLRRLATG